MGNSSRGRRAAPDGLRHAFHAPDEGRADLPEDGQSGAVQHLPDHTKMDSTVRSLGVELEDALTISKRVKIRRRRAGVAGGMSPHIAPRAAEGRLAPAVRPRPGSLPA